MRNLDRPIQAVILAGGLGIRMRPLTKSLPKPMIEVEGRPFLSYILDQLSEQGFKKVLLLLGYLPEKIVDFFGDEYNGMKIEYSISSVENETGDRLLAARAEIEDVFFLMYSDNFWPINFSSMWQKFSESDCKGLVTVYDNSDNYTKSNIKLNDENLVISYDKTRTSPGLTCVDIGFFILSKEIFALFPDEKTVSFEKHVMTKMVQEGSLLGYLTKHRYYSIGSHEKLRLSVEFLKRKRAIILDRDGVLNEKPKRGEYVTQWKDWRWIPGSIEAVRILRAKGYRIFLASNQAGIARGVMTENDLKDIHFRMQEEIGVLDGIYYCPHGWNDGCSCRKPAPGMLISAQKDHLLDLSQTFFVGDDERDEEAARAAGSKFFRVDKSSTLLVFSRSL